MFKKVDFKKLANIRKIVLLQRNIVLVYSYEKAFILFCPCICFSYRHNGAECDVDFLRE